MKIFPITDENNDDRRNLTAFNPPFDSPAPVEAKVLVVKHDGVRLGNHSHPHAEGFMLASGSCKVQTWTASDGNKEYELVAPTMVMFEPGEEHLLTCSKGMILVGYMPVPFSEQNNTLATHL